MFSQNTAKCRRFLLRPLPMLIAGLAIGALARVLDITTSNLGNMFSGLTVWVLLGVVISIYSPTPKAAAQNILPFCLGMLFTYYLTAILTRGVYGWDYILFWTAFALCTPLCAWLAWHAKGPGRWFRAVRPLPLLLSVGILLVTAGTTVLLFGRLRFYDWLLLLLTGYFLFGARR